MILSLPISYVFLKMGAPAWTVFAVTVIVNAITHVISWVIIYGYARYDVHRLLSTVYIPTLGVTALALLAPLAIRWTMEPGLDRLLISGIVSEALLIPMILFLGFNNNERHGMIYPFIAKLKSRIFPRRVATQP